MRIFGKVFILFILSTILIYLWSVEADLPEQRVQAEDNHSGSTIGGIEVESLDKDEIITLLNKNIEEWKETPTQLLEEDIEIILNPEWFVFDVETSVDDYFKQTEKPWFAFWKDTPVVHIPLQFTMDAELIDLVEGNSLLNKEETLGNIQTNVSVLSKEPIQAVFLDLSVFDSERIAFSLHEISVGNENLSDFIAALNGQVIPQGQVFSFLDKTKDVNSLYSDEMVDYIASMLYSVILQTDFEIVERHSQGKVPTYLEPGIEANIDLNANKDLKFLNKGNPAVLKVSLKDSSLLVELYSLPAETVGKYEVRDTQVVKPRTIYRYSSDLKAGEESLIQEGSPGLKVTVYRIISDKKGPYENEEIVSQDYYSPTHRIILKSSLTPETTPVVDPDLEIDLNADGLPDMENGNSDSNTPGKNSGNPDNNSSDNDSADEDTNTDEESGKTSSEDDLDTLPEGSYYDKAGNIITPK